MQSLVAVLQEKTKQSHVTFEQMCPQWSQRLKLGKSKNESFRGADGQEYSIVQANKCIIGEAWGRSNDYLFPRVSYHNGRGCLTCRAFGNNPNHNNFIRRDDPEFVQSFVNHMNEAHSDVLRGRGL